MKQLFIVNLYGTIIPKDGRPIVRAGFHEFLQEHEHVIVSAYKPAEIARADLDAIGVPDTLPVFGLEDKIVGGVICNEDISDQDREALLSMSLSFDEFNALAKKHKQQMHLPEYQVIDPMFLYIIREYNRESGTSFKPQNAVVISSEPNDIEHAMQRRSRGNIGTVVQVPEFLDEPDAFSFDRIDSLRHRLTHKAINALGLGPYKIELK